jgi:hypothetical protein
MPGYNKNKMADLAKGFHASTTDYDPIAKGISDVGDKLKGLFSSDTKDDSMGEALARRKAALGGMKKDYE